MALHPTRRWLLCATTLPIRSPPNRVVCPQNYSSRRRPLLQLRSHAHHLSHARGEWCIEHLVARRWWDHDDPSRQCCYPCFTPVLGSCCFDSLAQSWRTGGRFWYQIQLGVRATGGRGLYRRGASGLFWMELLRLQWAISAYYWAMCSNSHFPLLLDRYTNEASSWNHSRLLTTMGRRSMWEPVLGRPTSSLSRPL